MIEISTIKITDIKPAEYNPRIMSQLEHKKLRNSMETFGVVDPIIINLKNNHIIGGHQRYNVLLDKSMEDNEFIKELHLIKLGDVGWAFPESDLEVKDDDHEKGLNLALNNIEGEFDLQKLEPILTDLKDIGFDIELTGFSDIELTELNLENNLVFAQEFDADAEGEEDVDLEEIYDEPVKEMLQCPACDHVDVVKRFKRVDSQGE